MSLFDSLKDAASNIPGVNNALNSIQAVEGFVMPQELQNLQKTQLTLQEKITTLTAQIPENPAFIGDITQVRTYLMSYFRGLQEGGDPAPDAVNKLRIKAMPQFQELVASFDALSQQLASLEKQYQMCTYGFQLSDGSIQVPSMSWSEDQFAQVQSTAKDQTARCWLNADLTQYV